jgi:hypothetical protein
VTTLIEPEKSWVRRHERVQEQRFFIAEVVCRSMRSSALVSEREMVRFATIAPCGLVNPSRVTERTGETIVLPLKCKPPISFFTGTGTLGHSVLRAKMINRIVGADLNRLAIPALLMGGAF